MALTVVKMAQRFQSEILLSVEDIRIDAKSTLMAFILLEALKGQTLHFSIRGPDPALALSHLLSIFK